MLRPGFMCSVEDLSGVVHQSSLVGDSIITLPRLDRGLVIVDPTKREISQELREMEKGEESFSPDRQYATNQ